MSRKAPKRAQPSELTGPYATSPNYEGKPLAPPGNRHIPGRWGKSSSTAVKKGMRFGLLEPCKRDPNLQVFQQRLHTWPHPHNILEVFMHCDASQMLGSNYQWEMPWYWNKKNWRRNYNDHYDYDQWLWPITACFKHNSFAGYFFAWWSPVRKMKNGLPVAEWMDEPSRHRFSIGPMGPWERLVVGKGISKWTNR